ncbi:MAG: hypothetical protein KDI34_05485, partial [Halioglobus sp.]|nr:hypothetical protein [Halioglobus sp.]
MKTLSTPDENCTFVPAKIHHCLGERVFFQALTENSLGRAANEFAPERRRYGMVFREFSAKSNSRMVTNYVLQKSVLPQQWALAARFARR